jgi:putative phage-type endonuclease
LGNDGTRLAGAGELFTVHVCADNDEWLRERTRGVGGSDVAAIMGLSPWSTPLDVWLQKTGREGPRDLSDKPYVQFGNDFEATVMAKFAGAHEGLRVEPMGAMLRSIGRPWAQASLDGIVFDGDDWGVLEVKTARTKSDWRDGVPLYYQTQVTHYLSVTGRSFAYVAAFFRDSCEYEWYRVERDEDDVRRVDEEVDEFWHAFVEADAMPEIVGGRDADGLTALYGHDDGEVDALHGDEATDADALIDQYVRAKEREAEARAERKRLADLIMARIGGHRGIVTDMYRATWSRGESSDIDRRRLRDEMPDVYRKFEKVTTRNRGIRVTELGA